MIADFNLIQNYLNGDSDSFEQLYNRHKGKLYSYIHQLVGNDYQGSVDDIYQQTWIDAVKRLPKFKNSGSFYSWILRIAHSRFIDHCRKHKLKFTEVPDLIDCKELPGEELIRTERSIQLNEYIDKLSPELKEVVLLRKETITFKEIAKIQKVSINTVLSRMNYALKNLKKMYSQDKR